jgi:hypothetical protein
MEFKKTIEEKKVVNIEKQFGKILYIKIIFFNFDLHMFICSTCFYVY